MKRFISSSLAVRIAIAVAAVIALAYIVTHAAVPVGTGLSSPVMTNFNARYFTITLASGTTPTNVIQLNLPMGPGSPDLPGDIINIVNGTNLWTNDLGNLRPRVVQTQLNASNIVSHESLTSEGAFDITSTYTGILTLGSNSVPVFQNSYILLSTDAASTDPTLRTVYLSGMASQGQLLFLENVLGNAGTTTSAFQLTNGTPCYDVPTMTVALQNGNWSSTNAGESLFLQFDGISGWREVSRFFGALGGSGNSLWTNDAGILHPKDLTLPVMITNQLQLGPGSTNVLYRNADNQIVLTNGAITNGLSIVNGSNRVMHLGFKPLPNTDPRISSSSGFLWLNAVTILEGNLQPDSDLTRDIGNFSSSGGFRNTYVKGTNYTIGMNDGLGNYSRMAVYQVGTNTPLVFDQETGGTAGYSRGFSFRTNGVEIFNVTGTGGPSSGANWVASGTTNSTLAGTAFPGGLHVTSPSADNATNVAVIVDTDTPWLSAGSMPLLLRSGHTNLLTVDHFGGVVSGRHVAEAGYALTLEGPGFAAYGIESLGDPSVQIDIAAIENTSATNRSDFFSTLQSWSSYNYFQTKLNGTNYFFEIDTGGGVVDVYAKYGNGPPYFELWPDAGDGTRAYEFGTYNTHTSGNLLEIVNNRTNVCSVSYDGSISAAGSVNAASYQINGINGWTGFWTNMIPGVITQRICISGGATTNVITL